MAARSRVLAPFALVLASLIGSGCDGRTVAPDAGPGPDAGADAGPVRPPLCADPTAVPCTDESVLELALYTDPNPGLVENTPDGAGWITHVDATGGGFTPSLGYVYVRFTDEGVERVDLGDEAAFDSMAWDLALRRFVIRLNSGVSGPSCVGGARTAAATDYDALTAVPEGLTYRTEEYFTASCEIVPDGSGLGSPGTALQSFWEYPGCVQMTGNVYVVRLADGRFVKLTVTSYYNPAVQETCDTTGSVPSGSPTGAGNIRFRWAFIDP